MSAYAKSVLKAAVLKMRMLVLWRVPRAFGHSGGCVPGREGPEAGGTVEGGCFHVGRLAAGAHP